jgi:hypothetical protein
MKSKTLAAAVAFLLAGCASVEINPVHESAAADLWKRDAPSRNGYVIYAPSIVVEQRQVQSCVGEQCKLVCAFGPPFTLPDLSRPYIVNARPGFGSLSVEFGIAEGWRLDSMKQAVDNSAVLGALLSPPTSPQRAGVDAPDRPVADAEACKVPRLFLVTLHDGALRLQGIVVR